MENMGLIHIICGKGKGKTTSAFGMALRAAGAGGRVYIFQFLKGSPSGETESVKNIPNITVERLPKDYGFVKSMSMFDKKEVTDIHNSFLEKAAELMETGADMVILDEFFPAYDHGLMEKNFAEQIILEKKHGCEIVLTGREAAEKFIAAADYVSRIECVKHPYENGIGARKGVEF